MTADEPMMPHYENAADKAFEKWLSENPGALIKRDPKIDSLPFATAPDPMTAVPESSATAGAVERCAAALAVAGEVFVCDSERGHGMPHGSKAAEAIWQGEPDRESVLSPPEALTTLVNQWGAQSIYDAFVTRWPAVAEALAAQAEPDEACSTEGCPGDWRYAAPGRGHVTGCTYPLPPAQSPEHALEARIRAQREWSLATFGPGDRYRAILDHLHSELLEIHREPRDVEEWIDVVILALDGAWRAGYEPEAIVAALDAKYAKNRSRTWPDWRTADPDRRIEHTPDLLDEEQR